MEEKCVRLNCNEVVEWVQPLASQEEFEETNTYAYKKRLEEMPEELRVYMVREYSWHLCDKHLASSRKDLQNTKDLNSGGTLQKARRYAPLQ